MKTKPTESVTKSVRAPQYVWDAIAKRASAENRTPNAMAALMLAKAAEKPVRGGK